MDNNSCFSSTCDAHVVEEGTVFETERVNLSLGKRGGGGGKVLV